MNLKKYQPNFQLKPLHLKKARNSGLYKDTALKNFSNLVVTSLDHSFNAAFDVSFSKYADSKKNDRSNNKKLKNPVKTCAVGRETEKLFNVYIETQWAETFMER